MHPDDPRSTVLSDQPAIRRRSLTDGANQVLRSRSFWALADQGIASGSNFLTMILLTRNLPERAFGEFSLLWEPFMFLNGLHAALIVYPLSVRGARVGMEGLRQLSTIALVLSLLIAGPVGGSMFALGASRAFSIAIWATSAIVAFQVHETLRRALMSQFRYTQLIRGDLVGYLGQVIGVLLLSWGDHLSVQWVFAAMTISFLLASVVQVMCIGPRPATGGEMRETASEFWALGRWMLASALMAFFTGPLVQFCLAWHDLTHVAKFGAMQNLVRFANPILAAMTGLIIPAVSREGSVRAAGKYLLLGVVMLAPYLGALIIAPGFSVSLLYRADSEYLGYPLEVRITVASAAVLFASAALGAVLGGLGHSRTYFITQVANTIANAILVIPAAIIGGWRAATFAVLGSTSITLIVTVVLLLKNPRPAVRHAGDVPPAPR